MVLLIALAAVLLIGAGTAYGIIASHSGHPQVQVHDTPTSRATATATSIPPTDTPTSLPANAYTAQSPGPGCDQGSGQWDTRNNQAMSFQCSANGTTVTQPAGAQYLANLFFYGPRSGYSFPRNYTISVDTSQLTSTACVGIETRQPSGSNGGYGFFVCRNGSWLVVLYGETTSTTVANGSITESNSYHLEVAGNGSAQDFRVNNAVVHTLIDSTYTQTGDTALCDYSYNQGSSDSAIFSNFVYMPIPG